ncbi:MAG: HAMP domain-containing sensor histidine kinase [Bacillota bacterium]|nr:HAMP domain-containing sensor histidine kinase [Bacillota bacterium]
MKRNTIKWRIFKYNIIAILLLIAFTTVIFNVAVRVYMKKDILAQLDKISARTEDTALRHGPDFFPDNGGRTPPPPLDSKRDKQDIGHNDSQNNGNKSTNNNELYRYYFMLDQSLREPLSVLNADYILLDSSKKRITPPQEEEFTITSTALLNKIISEMNKVKSLSTEAHLNFNLSGTEYIAIVKQVSQKNSFGLGWVIIYSSLQKVNQLQLGINTILFAILALSALLIMIFSSLAAKKISAPFSSLNRHISSIAERNFGNKIQMAVDDELQELVNNINIMSEKLETYDKAQKTFLQNASHEFRTPLMSIQGYAEGIKHEVVDSDSAVDIIISESKRLTHLVEDLLYLSRLDTIEENYHYNDLDFNELICSCTERINGIAIKSGIKIQVNNPDQDIKLYADEEKLTRAITNVLSNCIRYAQHTVSITSKKIDDGRIELTIIDDGPGFDEKDLPNIFERFYKGKKGKFGLGLAISKNVIEKHNGTITAENSTSGALFRIELPVSG